MKRKKPSSAKKLTLQPFCTGIKTQCARKRVLRGEAQIIELGVLTFVFGARTKAGKRSHLSGSQSVSSKKVKGENKAVILEELLRKKVMVERYCGADSTESVKILNLTEKWKDAALEALEDLKRYSNSETKQSDYALLQQMQMDPKLLEVSEESE